MKREGKMQRENKRGQMILWVIIAIVIVVVIILIFFMKIKNEIITPERFTPQSFIQKCVRDSVLEATKIMMPQGGFINPENYVLYQNDKVEYLCQNIGNYKTCIMQHPALFNEEKQEIKDYILPEIESCFSNLKLERKSAGETIDYGPMILEVSLVPKKIIVDIERKTTITKNEDVFTFNNYKTVIDSPLYDLINVATDIANNEAKYCYFEYDGYMILHSWVDIKKFAMSDSTKIYTIEDKQSGDKFNMAVRGCAIPAGI